MEETVQHRNATKIMIIHLKTHIKGVQKYSSTLDKLFKNFFNYNFGMPELITKVRTVLKSPDKWPFKLSFFTLAIRSGILEKYFWAPFRNHHDWKSLEM